MNKLLSNILNIYYPLNLSDTNIHIRHFDLDLKKVCENIKNFLRSLESA